jgi:F420-non-reducing hydrogenase iron-sulfur subunit
MSDFEPKIVAFLCNWCSYAGADLAGVSRYQYPTNIRPVRVMCSTRISPHLVLELLKEGADGVMITGCHIGDCHYMSGNYYTEKRVAMMKKLVELAGMDPDRIRLEWVSASEGEKFANVVTDFVDQLKEMGSSPVGEDDRLMDRLEAATEAAKYFRLRVLNGKDIKLTEKGNVYGDVLDCGEFNELMEDATEDEYQRSLILQLTKDEAFSVKELAKEIGKSTEETLEHVVSLRSKNLLALDRIDDMTPRYKAILIGGA